MKTNQESVLSKLNPREQQFVKDVVNDMLFDANGIRIKMKGAKRIRAIMDSIALCIYESQGSHGNPDFNPPDADWVEKARAAQLAKEKPYIIKDDDDDDDWPD